MQARRGPLVRQVVACYRRQVEFASLKGRQVPAWTRLGGHEGCGGRPRRQYKNRFEAASPFGACRHHLPPAKAVGLWTLSDGAT